MNQQKTEEELTAKSIHSLEIIIKFLKSSKQYQHQKLLIKNVYSIVEGKNRPLSKGRTVKIRTLELLKIAVAHTKGLKTRNGSLYSQEEKVKLLDMCMKQVISHLGYIGHETIQTFLTPYLITEDRVSAIRESSFFKSVWGTKELLSALFMGEETRAEKIVRAHPDLLFEKGTYNMPLLNQDGTPTHQAEQIYCATPLQLMFYTGDWNMWEKILPLIPEKRLNETLYEMRKIPRGGPDVVKINQDLTQLSVHELQHYYERNANDQLILDDYENPIAYDLLSNPDGIFYVEANNGAQFYHIAINSKTTEKSIRQLFVAPDITAEDELAFQQFIIKIRDAMPMNSSRRSTDNEHALFSRIFGIELERNGIHYQLNGISYQDTYDGSFRLQNAYRKFKNLYKANRENIKFDEISLAWSNVGMAQRFSMVHIIQRFCERNHPFYPLQNNNLNLKLFIRNTEFSNFVTNTTNIYPLRINSDLGYNFGLSKGLQDRAFGLMWASALFFVCPKFVDLDALLLFEKMRTVSFNERIYEFEQRLHSLTDQSLCPGCIMM